MDGEMDIDLPGTDDPTPAGCCEGADSGIGAILGCTDAPSTENGGEGAFHTLRRDQES